MKNYILMVAICFCWHINYGQQHVVDSLIKKTHLSEGIEKAKILNELAEMFLDSDPERSIKYADSSLEQAMKHDDALTAYYAHLFKSNAYRNMGNIDTSLKILQLAKEQFENDLGYKHQAQLNMHLGNAFVSVSSYENALKHQLIALEKLNMLGEGDNQKGVKMLEMNIHSNIGQLFSKLKNFTKGLDHFEKALNLSIERGDSLNEAFIYNNIGITHEQQKNYTLALENYLKALDILEKFDHTRAIGSIKVNISLLYLFKKNYQKALQYGLDAMALFKDSPNLYAYTLSMHTVGRVYLGMKDADKAYDFLSQSFQLATHNNYEEIITDSYEFLGEYYALKGDYKKAYNYNRQYVSNKDSIYDIELSERVHELQARYETEKKEQEIALLTKDNEIKDLRNRRQNALILIFVGFVVLLGFVGFFWIRSNRQKHRFENSEMEKRNLETEQKLLRAQINPHFLFNALNSVQSYISANDSLKAMTYLAKFSHLMRNILENSRKTMITLEDEISSLKLYMELESMRFVNMFEFKISVIDEIIPSRTYIPPMLIQPFVENSIKHGFKDSIKKGTLHIDFLSINGMLTCQVEDNGIGRKKAQEIKREAQSTHHSLGMQVTHERFESIKKDSMIEVGFDVKDLLREDGKSGGTRVILKLPYEIE